MSQRTRINFKSTVDNAITSNATGAITGTILNQSFTDVEESTVFHEDFLPITAANTDTYTCTMAIAPADYTVGRFFLIKFTNANTGAATLNVNSLGAKSIKKNGSTALAAGDIAAGQILLLGYDGTNFQLSGNITSEENTILTSKTSVSSAEILAAYTTPKELVAAPGAGKVILPLSVFYMYTYLTAAYATNTTVVIGYDGSSAGTSVVLGTKAGFLNQATNFSLWISLPNTSANDSQSINSITNFVNKNLCFSVSGGNPTAGSGTLVVYLTYKIITL